MTKQHRNRLAALIAAAMLLFAAPFGSAWTILTLEHVDLGIAYKAGAWDLHLHDESNDIEYAPGEALLYVGDAATTPRPAGTQWDFIGIAPGEDVWILPAVQNPLLLFLGVGAEEVEAGTFASYFEGDPRVQASGAWLRLELLDVVGPGHFSVWTSDAFGAPVAWMSSFDRGITAHDSLFILEGTHTDYNWTFTETGLYDVTVRASAFLDDGAGGLIPVMSEEAIYTFGVKAVPEPAAAALLAVGGVLLRGRRRDRAPQVVRASARAGRTA